MKPEEIIYFNELSGLTEPFYHFNVTEGNVIQFNGWTFTASRIAKELYLDGKTVFEISAHSDNGKNKMKQRRIYEAVFSLEDKTPDCLTVRLDEKSEGGSPQLVARVQFIKRENACINNVSGRAIVRIYDVVTGPELDWFIKKDKALKLLGQFAVAVGLYFFTDLDGDWEKLDNSGTFTKKENDELQKTILQSNEKIKKDILNSNEEIKQGISDIKLEQKETNKIIADGYEVILKRLDTIISDIAAYKKDVDEQLSTSWNQEDEETVIEDFSNRVVSKINRSFAAMQRKNQYESTKDNLKEKFGEQWEKMSETSQDFLITADVLFKDMISMDSQLDYSGICILVTKAMESELKRRFYDEFMEYLESRFPRQYEQWHYALYKISDKKRLSPLPEAKFTLGSVPQVFCLYQPDGVSDEAFEVGKKRLLEFMTEKMSIQSDEKDIDKFVHEIGASVNRIKNNYRNPAAHIRPLSKTDAQQCFDDVVYVKELLIRFLKGCRL